MRHALKLHPASSCAAVTRLEVEVARPRPKTLGLRYVLTGDLAAVALPAPVAQRRADELWRHSCFEAFLRADEGDGYYEFNLAPTTEWAAYRFDSYRAGMSAPDVVPAPRLVVHRTPDRFVLEALLRLDALPDVAGDGPWRMALTAVVEEAAGGISYWSFAHPSGKADFHHPEGFAALIPAPERP